VYIDYGFWAYVGEIMRFMLAIAWIAGAAVLGVHLLRYTIKVYEKVRWWK
jgi:hypothetical protein